MISAVILLYLLLEDEDKVKRYIKAVIVWTAYCFVATEVISLFQGISMRNLWLCWGVFDIALLGIWIRKHSVAEWRSEVKKICSVRVNSKNVAWFLFTICMIMLAVKTVPYNWDSMTYHLPRIFHWHQNGTVAHYATYNDRQVASPVLGAFIELHIYTMSGGREIFLNLMQCFSFLSNGILIFHIAKKLKCSDTWCVLASALFYAMPIAFAEALTTQVDNLAAFWMLCFVYLLFDLLDLKKKILLNKQTSVLVVSLSLCIAFGYLAKPSVCIGMVFFAIWLLFITVVRKDSWKTLGLYLLMSCGIILVVLMPELTRNIITYNAIASSGTGQRQLAGTLHPVYLLVNGLKNFTFNLPTAWIYNSSELIYKVVSKISVLLGVDINNPAIAEDGREFSVHHVQDFGHDTAVNPVISWLFLVCILFFVFRNRKRGLKESGNQYFLISGFSFFVFCMALRWEPFVSRYMISYLAVLCPAICVQMEMFFNGDAHKAYKGRWGMMAITWFLCVTEFAGLLYYHADIAKHQNEAGNYFVNRDIKETYNEIAAELNGGKYREVGLIIGGDSYEYPLTTMAKEYERFEHVNVQNVTSKYEDTSFIPEVIVVVDRSMVDDILECHGQEYIRYKDIDDNNSIFILEQ